jgi:putative inorganic carbon (HCO3(-)) transporter
MSVLTQQQIRGVKLDGRWFAAFMLLQVVALVAILLGGLKFVLLAVGGVVAGLIMVLLLLYPWIVVPALVVTTALDITGRLIHLPSIGVPLTGFHLSMAIMVITLPINMFLRRRIELPVFELKGPLMAFLLIIAISLTYSPNQPEATIYFMRVVALVFFMYLTQIMIDSKQAVTMVMASMTIAIIAASAMGAWQVATGEFHLSVTMVSALGANVPRATATFDNPNIFGAFLMSGVIPLLGVLLNYRMRWWQQGIVGLACLIGALGTLATFSRSTWLSMGVGVLVVLWLGKKLRYLFAFVLISLLLMLLLKEFVPFAAFIFDRFTTIFTIFEEFGSVARTSGTARVYLILASFEMFLDHPILGVGWRSFPIYLHDYAPPGYPWWSLVDENHTVLSAILAEVGLVGLTAALWFIGRTFWIGATEIDKMQDPYLRSVLIGVVAVFVSFQVNQSFNGDFSNNIFWFYIGMLFAVIHIDRKARAA